MIQGIGVSAGIAIGQAFVIKKTTHVLTGVLLNESEVASEIARFEIAVSQAANTIQTLIHHTEHQEDLAILETQIEFINDPQLRDDVVDLIKTKKGASDALTEVIDGIVTLFESMEDEYMRGRAADVKDIGGRILAHLHHSGESDSKVFPPGTILIAQDLSPSDTITMDLQCINGFVTAMGSKTSHTAIIAKSKTIPAVLSCGAGIDEIKTGDLLIVDGQTGLVLINPTEDTLSEYASQMVVFKAKTQRLKSLKNIKAVTMDGFPVTLSANIAHPDEMDVMLENGGEGVGLLRTEMLFMDRDSFPTEEEQFNFYRKAALLSRGKPVIIRTIDIGGDKHLPYFNLPAELNPFLGYRAIRICLDRTDLFITQLKAILRASVLGDLKIMLPMISNVQEVRMAKKILSDAKKQLTDEGLPFRADIQVGIMIEIPSAAVTADLLAKEVDFFSIGTNDLCQYTLAVDRMNEKISHLYDPYNPGVLRLIDNVIKQGEKQRIHVGMCGEMASDPMATLLLLGMGLKDFSMSAASIPDIKNILINNNMAKAEEIYREVMAMDNSTEITAYLIKSIHHDK